MDRCSACPGINTCIPLHGPGSSILFIGEAPGFDENRKGIPFIGKTGMEVNEHYLPLAGLRRESSTFTNAIKCLPDRPKGKLDLSREKDKDLLLTCAKHHLFNEIDELQPSLLVTLGAFAAYAIDPEINLELHHGIPLTTDKGTVFPMYHPSQGIHEPKKILLIRNDWIRLRRYLRGTLSVVVDKYPNPDYTEASNSDISDVECTIDMAADTEWSRSKGPYCITYSQEPGVGRLIRAENSALLAKFQVKLDKWESKIYFHNWPYDWTIVEDMGLQFPIRQVHDTMMMVYHLGNLPQGLKTLAYRLLGMEMQDFEDLVKPYSAGRVFDYYRLANTFKWPKPDEQLLKDDKSGKWRVKQPQGLSTKLKRLFTELAKGGEKDIFKVWDTWVDHQVELESKCGPYWGLDIADVPFSESLRYACRDSDAVIRLVPILKRMKEVAMTGKLQEQWDA